MIVRLGRGEHDGKIVSNIKDITAYVHELSHTVSERNLAKEPIRMKQDCVSEIESSIMENLFMSYLDKNKVRLATMFSRAGVLPNADTRYVDELVENYYLEHDKGLLDKVNMIKNKEYNPDEPFQKQYEFRYLVGDVYAYLLMDTYKKNPEKAVEQYAKFLECNASLSLDDCSKVLFDDQTMTSNKVVEAFAYSLDRKTQKIVEKQEERNMQ